MKTFIKSCLLILSYLMIYLAFQVFFAIAFMAAAIIGGMSPTVRAMTEYSYKIAVPILLPSALISLILYAVILKTRKINIISYCRLKKVSIPNIISIILSVSFLSLALLSVISYIVKFFPSYEQQSEIIMRSSESVFSVIILTILGPIFEEILFRGIILNDIAAHLNIVLSVIIQGVLFGIYHMNLLQGLYATVLGIVFGFIYIKTQSLFASMTAHITFNILGTMVLPYVIGDSAIMLPIYIIVGSIAFIIVFRWFYKNNSNEAAF